ncbi:somatostatin receptor type 5-like [Mytilus trossulus]|uniref:somatostatin receptor type 5-like n=1 Tax=Mytilus trossulus TaxID=6551 RepID=UPI0030045A43
MFYISVDLETDIMTSYNHTLDIEGTFIAPTSGTDFDMRKYSIPILCIIGFIGNTLSTVLFLGRSLRGFSCCVFLGVRSVTDNGFLATLFIAWFDFLDVRLFHTTGICHIMVFLAYICSFLSVWCVVCVTIENYVRVSYPLLVKLYCTSKTAWMIILFLTFSSFCIYNMPLWSNEIAEIYQSYYCVTKEEFQNYQLVLTYIDTAVTLIIPLIIILTLMFIIVYKGFRTSKRRLRLGHHRRKYRSTPSYGTVTGLLTAVSITFLCLHTPIHIFKLKVIIETISTKNGMKVNPTERTIGNVFQVMYYLNASVNILVYYICGGNFRKVFKKVLCKDVSCCCYGKQEEDRLSDAGTTELTSILDKGDGRTRTSL